MCITCHDRAYLSSSQPYRALNEYEPTGTRTFPPGDSCSHIASTSRVVLHFNWKDTDRLNLNDGPTLIAMNGTPASSKDTRSQSPDSVPDRFVTFVTREPGNKET
jgi:hypothetical protein